MNSARGRCHDNARCESMWARLKEELLYNPKDVAQIILQGKWVEKWGFTNGSNVRVECYQNKLVIVKEDR